MPGDVLQLVTVVQLLDVDVVLLLALEIAADDLTRLEWDDVLGALMR